MGPEDFTVIAEDGCQLRGLRYRGNPNGRLTGTALCLSGLTSDANSMQLIAPLLVEAGFQVIAPDMRGHGLSDESAGRKMNLRQFTRDAVHICMELGETSIFIISQSYGGCIGIEMLRSSLSPLTVEGLYSFGPPWLACRPPLRDVPKVLYRISKYVGRIGLVSGFSRIRQPERQDYISFKGIQDFHRPLLVAEAKSLSWVRYARLIYTLRIREFGPAIKWEKLAKKNVHLFLARSDKVINNREIEAISERTTWPITWVEGYHVSLMINPDSARVFVEAIINLRSKTL